MKVLLLLIMFAPCCFTAQINLDSLWQVWEDPSRHDTIRLNAMETISWDGYLFSQPDSAFYFAQLQYELAEKIGRKKSMAIALNTQGISFAIRGDYSQALPYLYESLSIRKELNDQEGIAISYNNIGNIYKYQGDYANAIEHYHNSLKIKEKRGDKKGMASSYTNIGIIYYFQKDFDKALSYHQKCYEIEKEIGNENGEAMALHNIGLVYADQKEYDKALKFYEECLVLKKKLDDKKGLANTYNNMGLVYFNLGDEEQAMTYYEKSIELKEALGMKSEMATTLNNLGNIYLKKKDFEQAAFYCDQALDFAQEVGADRGIRDAAGSLYESYKALGKSKIALEMYELHISVRDSLLSEENQKAIIQQQFKYEYEKKSAADSIKALEAAKVQEALLAAEKAETEKQKKEVKQQEQQKYYLFAGLGLALLFGGFIFNRFRVTNQQKKIIEEQKVLVEQQKEAVERQKVELEQTHQQLEEHHQEIADSILYAKRIQEAIMPSMESMNTALKDGFVLYLPKDVVAGDFFWMESFVETPDSKEEVVYFAAADCTGHGVPGAMVSVVCSNALNKALLEEGLRDTGKLLDRTREIVIDRLAKSGEEVKDGMDISLCALNSKTKELQWSGANNPIWILRKGAQEIEEIKANKQPIGLYHDPQPFTAHQINLNQGDSVYVFTDGYQDQFGGPKGKKFKAKQLKEVIVDNQHLPMDEQMKLLQSKFMEWKGAVEQIDDVCVIGVRI
ncbi:tetratricopeptide repeat protein [Parvicella tangerina]|uniref:Photosystem I assembly protein Ycf3 n=1 Tax=Parvicella tangerina TaxID=2829795 RepID=A0A916JMY1_9FLAO|nr:tetratricopeptide repeat protein [Parvicella tangerina]CAG5082323.1 Photosystem I assembly protein Ycf3 [Parvicella tangerina]